MTFSDTIRSSSDSNMGWLICMIFSGMTTHPAFQSRFSCLATENRTQDTGHARFNTSPKKPETKVRNKPGVIVGYWVGRPFWGNGIATEALHALVSHSFLDLHTDCIWGVHYSDNKSSEAVLEKCGFHPVCQYEEAYYPLIDEYHNTIIRAITLREWSMRNRTTRQ